MAAYASLKSRNFRFLLASSVLSVLAQQMLSIVVGWDLYESTHSAVVLGNVGLVQIIPPILFTFAAGYAADHYRPAANGGAGAGGDCRRWVPAGECWRGAWCCVDLHLSTFVSHGAGVQWPASSALLPQLVEPEELTSAIGWQGTGREMATVTGPAVAGLLLAWKGSEAVYLVQALCALASAGCYTFMRAPARAVRIPAAKPAMNWKQISEGVRFIFREKVILAALSLDLLAVFFGGAVTLLPIFAQDILESGLAGWVG